MRLLLVAATSGEIAPLVASLRPLGEYANRVTRYDAFHHELDVLVTGVGMVATAARCSHVLGSGAYELALNVGVCGSFRPTLSPGSVVHVESDCIAELGAEDGDAFLTVHDLDLLAPDEPPLRGGRLVNPAPPQIDSLSALPRVAGITVNTVHGREQSIACITRRLNPDVETMEGAAFMYSCLVHGVPFAQIRAVSNIVERRNREAWKLAEAISNLTDVTRHVLQQV